MVQKVLPISIQTRLVRQILQSGIDMCHLMHHISKNFCLQEKFQGIVGHIYFI